MTKALIGALIVACPPLLAQNAAEAREKFAGTWEARWKDQVICTIRLTAGEPISGESVGCSIHIDQNGDLQAPDSNELSDMPAAILNPKLEGDMLTFEEEDGDEVTKFELKLVGERKAELRFPGAPVVIKPIPFLRR